MAPDPAHEVEFKKTGEIGKIKNCQIRARKDIDTPSTPDARASQVYPDKSG